MSRTGKRFQDHAAGPQVDPDRDGPGGQKAAARWRGILVSMGLLVATSIGCTGPEGGNGWLGAGQVGGERWTIRCLRSGAPEHAQLCSSLAESLRATDGIRASDVRVETGAAGSTIYYGEYVRARSASTGELRFPAKMQEDLNLIQSLALNQQRPFALAIPERMDAAPVAKRGKWDVRNIAGVDKLTLLIAVFYNTPTFDQRKEVAEQYVQQLRDDGYQAYLLHEATKSYVYVGEFDRSQFIQRPDGQWWYGPEVKELVAGRADDEFRYMKENGHRMRYYAPDGRPMLTPSQLVPVPRAGSSGLWGR